MLSYHHSKMLKNLDECAESDISPCGATELRMKKLQELWELQKLLENKLSFE